MTRTELLSKVSSYELSEWQALWSLRAKEAESRRQEQPKRGWRSGGTLRGGKKGR